MKSLSQASSFLRQDCQLIIFDKDGTIFDIHHYWLSMMRLRTKTLLKMVDGLGERELKDHSHGLMTLMGANSEEKKLKPDGPIGVKPRAFIEEIVADYMARFSSKFTLEKIKEVFRKVDVESTHYLQGFLEPLPGVVDFIQISHKAGRKLAIATTDITSRAELALECKGLRQYFHFVAGADLVENSKPAADIGKLIIETLNIDASSAAMVGDHRVDALMAQNANLGLSISVLTGLSPRSEFTELESVIVEDLTSFSGNTF